MVQDVVMFIVLVLGLIAAFVLLVLGNIYAPYRAYKASEWGWFWAILLIPDAGLLGLIYINGPDYRHKRRHWFERAVIKQVATLHCSECDAAIREKAKACHNCGVDFTKPTCLKPGCGAELPEGANFCDQCGSGAPVRTVFARPVRKTTETNPS